MNELRIADLEAQLAELKSLWMRFEDAYENDEFISESKWQDNVFNAYEAMSAFWANQQSGRVMVTTEQFQSEEQALNALVDAFADEMKKKLIVKMQEGYGGWDDPQLKGLITSKLHDHVERGTGQMVDVANLAAMLWNMHADNEVRAQKEDEDDT